MGTWGTGNFESDSALDVLALRMNAMIERVREVFSYTSLNSLYDAYGESDIIANVDILGTLFESYRIYPDLELQEVRQWKADYLDTYDRVIKIYANAEPMDFIAERREVVSATFDRVLAVMQDIIQDADDIT
jgi:hypothetical protein